MTRLIRILLPPLVISLLAVPGASAEEGGCVRGEPEALFEQSSPGVEKHSFNRRSSHEADEEVVFESGDVLRIRNWGCEYFVNTFHYESGSFQGNESDIPYWFRKAAEVLSVMARAKPNAIFDLQRAAATVESRISDGSKLGFDHPPYAVEGDGTDFLQTRVVVKNGHPPKGGKLGFVEFELMKGPL